MSINVRIKWEILLRKGSYIFFKSVEININVIWVWISFSWRLPEQKPLMQLVPNAQFPIAEQEFGWHLELMQNWFAPQLAFVLQLVAKIYFI